MTTSHRSPKRTRYEHVARTRSEFRMMATMFGWTPLDVLGAALTQDGEIVVITKDGERYGASVPASAVVPPDPVGRSGKRVYAPKSWNPARWNENRLSVIKDEMTKEQYFAEMTQKAGPDDALKLKHLRAVLDALPDTPDWYLSLPVAEESETES